MERNTRYDEKEIMTKKDVMEYLCCSRSLVDAIFRAPGFPVIKIGNKSIVKRTDFFAYFDYYARIGHRIPIG